MSVDFKNTASAQNDILRPKYKKSISRWRRLTSLIRRLPDFVILGAQRAGSTSLYRYLEQHPCVIPAVRKEIHFFDWNYDKGLAWYRAHFPTRFARIARNIEGCSQVLTGEASPYYITHPHAAARMRRVLPNVRLMIILRNPIDRAYSQYQMNYRKGIETISFDEAIRKEPDRLASEIATLNSDPSYKSLLHRRFSYLTRGHYAEQIHRWFEAYPREQFLVLFVEQLSDQASQVMNRVFDFLDLPKVNFDWLKPSLRAYNKAEYQPMRQETRDWLRKYYEEPNLRLKQLLAESLPWD